MLQYLRKKGLASADKKAGRVAAEGAVWSYIHAGSRLGVLVEVNCETDFVARGEKFRELVNDMAMQVGGAGAGDSSGQGGRLWVEIGRASCRERVYVLV